LQAEDTRCFMAVVRILFACPTRSYSPLQGPVIAGNANHRHLSPDCLTVTSLLNADFSFAIGNFSHRTTYTCDGPRLRSDEHAKRRGDSDTSRRQKSEVLQTRKEGASVLIKFCGVADVLKPGYEMFERPRFKRGTCCELLHCQKIR
jgi:hypothetical protein